MTGEAPRGTAFDQLAQVAGRRRDGWSLLAAGFSPPEDSLVEALASGAFADRMRECTAWSGQPAQSMSAALAVLDVVGRQAARNGGAAVLASLAGPYAEQVAPALSTVGILTPDTDPGVEEVPDLPTWCETIADLAHRESRAWGEVRVGEAKELRIAEHAHIAGLRRAATAAAEHLDSAQVPMAYRAMTRLLLAYAAAESGA